MYIVKKKTANTDFYYYLPMLGRRPVFSIYFFISVVSVKYNNIKCLPIYTSIHQQHTVICGCQDIAMNCVCRRHTLVYYCIIYYYLLHIIYHLLFTANLARTCMYIIIFSIVNSNFNHNTTRVWWVEWCLDIYYCWLQILVLMGDITQIERVFQKALFFPPIMHFFDFWFSYT